jgi:hypothetical protein
LQSIRALTRPSVPKEIVYFALSSGVSVFSSLLWNFTSCQDVPPRAAAEFGAAACSRALQATTSKTAAKDSEPKQVLFTQLSRIDV